MSRVILLISIAFKAWMFIDAVWRRAPTHWYWIILVVPFGGLAYLLAYRLRQPGAQQVRQQMLGSMRRSPKVRDLRAVFEDSPSHANRVRLAQGLYDAGEMGEARELFEQVVADRGDDRDGLYGLGLTRLDLGDLEGALEPLTRLIRLHKGYRDYAAWPFVAHALNELGRGEECLSLFEELAAVAPRPPHRVLLAEYLIGAGQPSRGRQLLQDVIEEHQRSPRHVRRQYRPSIRRARRLLRTA